MVSMSIFHLSQKLVKLYPTMNTRAKKFQGDLNTCLTSTMSACSSGAQFVAQLLTLRDVYGRQVYSIVLETKMYNFLQVKVI